MSRIRTPSFASISALICLVGGVFLLYFGLAQAQSQPATAAVEEPLWQEVDQSNLVQSASLTTVGGAAPTRYRLFKANLTALDAILAQAPAEDQVSAANAPAVLTLPMPDGSLQRFAISEYAMLEPAFAAARPDLKTYQGRSLDKPGTTVQVSQTPWGFHSMVLTGGRQAFVDPQPGSAYFISYTDQDLPVQSFSDAHIRPDSPVAQQPNAVTVSGDKLHVYRTAIAATSEFSQESGGVQAAQGRIVAFVNDMNGIYQRDLSVRFSLIDNTNIVYAPGSNDPYSNGNAGAMLSQNQTNLDQTIGTANYDIGYVIGTNMGGIAALNAVCTPGRKASGSGSIGGVSLHEIGHLFGGGHTFNANSAAAQNCSGGNYMDSAAYEPGSGSTILSYSGICGPQNIGNTPNDNYFHAISIQEMTTYINGGGSTCGTHNPTGNAPPTVNAGENRTIPARTAFTLVGQATDPNGDPLTYNWEQFDQGQAWTASTLPNTDLGNNPIFRSYPPTGENFRTFPSLNSPFAATGESLPTTNRALKFRLTVRDGKGGVNAGDVTLQVNNAAGPFTLNSPQAGAIWAPGSQQPVTWNVANTDQAPISCAAVDILASGDGGKTFTALVSNTPNDGSENVVAPNSATPLLIKVACANNVFHAISPKPGVNICNAIFVDNHEAGTGNWTATTSAGNDAGWEAKNDNTKANSGSNYWFTSFFGFGTTTLDSQARPATQPNPTLTFYHRYFFNPLQTGKVQINVNNGGWQDLKGFAGKSPTYDTGYAAETIPLGNFIKQNDSFQLRFSRTTGFGGINGLDTDGWFLDDVSVCGAPAIVPPTPTPTTPPNPTATPTAPPEATATNTPEPTPTPIPVIGDGEVTWTGNGATDDWNDGANWNSGQPPTGAQNVAIPAGLAKYPTISNNAAVKDLNIASGATVNMTAGILTVRGNFGGANADGRQEICQDLTGGENGNPNPKLFGRNAVSDTLVVPVSGRLTDLNLFLDVNHTWVGDIVASLKHGDNNVTVLDPSDDNCDADNFAITLSDEATAPVAPACVSGNTPAFPETRYQPNQALSAFDNQTFAGPWVLTLQDIYPDADNGQLRKWCLIVTSDNPVGRFNATGGRVVFSGEFAHVLRASPDSTFHDVQISEGSAQQVNLGSDLDINGSLELAAGGALHAGDGNIKLAGNWTQADNASFDPGNGSVVFDGGQQSITGNPHFNKLTVSDGSVLDMSDYELAVDSLLDNDGVIRQTKLVNGNEWVTFNDAGGYGGLDINANGLDLGLTTVTITQDDLGCTSKPNETIQRCFEIEPANKTARNADLRFYYEDEEQAQNSCSSMQAYQIDEANSFLQQLNRFAVRCSISPRGLWVDGVTDFTVSQIVLGAAVGEPGSRADEPPVAISDTLVTELDTAITIEALQNDFDPEGTDLTLDSIGQASHGTAKLTRSGQIDYTPAQGFTGTDTFTYEISDINDNKSSGTITVVVVEVKQPVYLPLVSAPQPRQQAQASGWHVER